MEHKLKGELIVERQNRETGEWLEPLHADNTITADGKHRFLQILVGHSSLTLAAATARLVILNGSLSTVRTLHGVQSTYPKIKSANEPHIVQWRWADEEAGQTYDAANVRIERAADAGAAVDYIFSNIVASLGVKPTDQNWYYTYQVTLTSASSAFTPIYGSEAQPPVKYSGLGEMIQRFAGLFLDPWSQGVMRLYAYDWDNAGAPNPPLTVEPGEWPPNSSSTIPGALRAVITCTSVSLTPSTGVGTPDRVIFVFYGDGLMSGAQQGYWRLAEFVREEAVDGNEVEAVVLGIALSQQITGSNIKVQFTLNITLT
jgi:hypothetical protein